MARLLYVVTNSRPLTEEPLFPSSLSPTDEAEVVLVQDAVQLTQVPTSRVSVLNEDLQSRGLSSVFPQIGYPELVEKIFQADRVIRL